MGFGIKPTIGADQDSCSNKKTNDKNSMNFATISQSNKKIKTSNFAMTNKPDPVAENCYNLKDSNKDKDYRNLPKASIQIVKLNKK